MNERRESFLSRFAAGRKPGLMSRLSHLIVVQVVFVFTAIVLIVFNPGEEVSISLAGSDVPAGVSLLATRVVVEAGGAGPENFMQGLSREQFVAAIAAESAIVQAVLYEYQDGALHSAVDYQRDSTEPISVDWDESPLGLIRNHVESAASGSPPVLPLNLTEDYVVYGVPLLFADGTPGALVLVASHNLYLSDRSNLRYALFVLFLCAALVALLTVYLVHRHFTRPFRRMIHGFEKTSEGELFYLMENSGDEEIHRLASVFNKLSRNLLDGRKQLSAYDEQLRDASSSLEESQLLLSSVIDNSPVGVITTNPLGKILLFNRMASALFGCEEAEAIGRPVSELFASDIEERARTHEREADEHGLEVIGKGHDGAQFAAFLITSTLRNESQECIGYVYIVRDISQSKDFQEMMIRLDRYYTKGEMAGDIAHEINNYLSILLGNTELVPLLLRKGNMERLDQKLELMHATIEKIARLTDGLLDSSRDQVHFDRADINQLVASVVSFLKPQNRFDNTEVITDCAGDIPLVEMDTSLMHQLLVNLIYNAGDAVDGDPAARIRIRTLLGATDGAPTLSISVEDNGPGVAENKLPLLFKKRFTTKPHGHGIGLLTCRKIVDAHGGEITYTCDQGAHFTVTIPVERSTAVVPAAAAPATAAR